MKTIKQWLKEGLNKEDYWRAEQYENTVWEEEKGNFKRALFNAFIWMKTIEGEGYWEKIYDNEGSLQPDQTDTKLTVDPKFIKRIHELSSPEVKQQLEQEFPSLMLNLEKGVWYNYRGHLLCYTGEGKSYGFWGGKWVDDWHLMDSELDKLKVATEEDVRDALIKEAKKRGYKTGNFVCLRNKVVSQSVDDYDKWTFMGESLYTKGRGLGGDAPYRDGKWAEILSTTFTLDEAKEFIAKIRGVAKDEIIIETN